MDYAIVFFMCRLTFCVLVASSAPAYPIGNSVQDRTSGMEHWNGILEWPKLFLKVMGFNYNL